MAIKKRPISPRQKMINLMYLVLMAMLALNISTEVLNGFSIVEESLNRTTANSSKENEVLYADFAEQMKANPQKVKEWFDKATAVKRMSDSIYNYAQQLKIEIVREADGKDADVANIKNKDDLEAASHVMLAPGTGQGGRLFRAINSFRERILTMVTDPHQRSIIESNLTTKLPAKAHTMGKNWQEYMFEDMPVAGAVTLLSKLQSDVRYAEGEVLHSLVANIDMKDIRVNRLSAFVIPESRTVISGDQFAAQIVMAAVDTTQQPEIYVGGRRISNGLYRFTASGVGEHSRRSRKYNTPRLHTEVYRCGTERHSLCRPYERALRRLRQSYQREHPRRTAQRRAGFDVGRRTAQHRHGTLHSTPHNRRQRRHHQCGKQQRRTLTTDGQVHIPCAQVARSSSLYTDRYRPFPWRLYG